MYWPLRVASTTALRLEKQLKLGQGLENGGELRIAPSSPVEDRCLGFLERLNTRRGLDGGVDELGLALTLRLSLSTVFSIVRFTRL